jgi:E3 ubiquitin-protein ligase SHPRH
VVKLRKISDWALKLSSLDRRTVTSILYPLLRLRQACCHPQAVRGEFLPLQKRSYCLFPYPALDNITIINNLAITF